MTSNHQPAIVRCYVDLPRDMSERLNVAAAELRTSKKRIMEELITKFLAERDSKRGKAK